MNKEVTNSAWIRTTEVLASCTYFFFVGKYYAWNILINHKGWLIIWDRMFGTFQEEKEDEEIVYGLVDPVNSFNPLYLQVV